MDDRRPRPLAILTVCLIMFVALIVLQGLVQLGVHFVLLIGLTLWARLSFRAVVNALSKLWLLVVISLLIHIAVTLFSLDWRNASVLHAIFFGITAFAARVVMVLWIGAVANLSHRPQRYLDELFRLRLGPSRLGRWLTQAELLLGFAMSFVPMLAAERERIEFAGKSRGLHVPVTWTERLRFRRAMLFPLLVSALQRSEYAAVALLARGYDPRRSKTHMRHETFRWAEWLSVVLFAVLCAINIIAKPMGS